jgi:hypothetical protein
MIPGIIASQPASSGIMRTLLYQSPSGGVTPGSTLTLTGNAPAGSTIVIIGTAYSNGDAALTTPGDDSAGNAYTQAVQSATTPNYYNAAIFYCFDAAALTSGSSTIKAPGNTGNVSVTAYAVAGLTTGLDKTDSGISSTGSISIATGTLSASEEIVFAALNFNTHASGFTEAVGFTQADASAPTTGGYGWDVAYDIVNATTSVTYDPSWTGAQYGAAVIASFY